MCIHQNPIMQGNQSYIHCKQLKYSRSSTINITRYRMILATPALKVPHQRLDFPKENSCKTDHHSTLGTVSTPSYGILLHFSRIRSDLFRVGVARRFLLRRYSLQPLHIIISVEYFFVVALFRLLCCCCGCGGFFLCFLLLLLS